MAGAPDQDQMKVVEEIPDGLWDQRKQHLERRLLGKRGSNRKFNSPLAKLVEKPAVKMFSEEEDAIVYIKKITIITIKFGNKNMPREPLVVEEQNDILNECLNNAWERINQKWATYWNPAAPGTPGCTVPPQ